VRQVAIVSVSASLLGSAVLTGVLLAIGGVDDDGIGIGAAAPAWRMWTPLNVAAIYARSAPGVVAITATQPSTAASGAGFAIDGNGHVLTADHVIAGASSISVAFQDGTSTNATVLGQDRSTDAAVLKINPSGHTLRPLALGSNRSLLVGDSLAVIGGPFGFNRSLSTGVVSALGRTIQAPSGFPVADAIQTDAAINPGSSGGPVLDAHGAVVGIVDQMVTGSPASASDTGVGFAVPIDVVKTEVSQLERGAHVAHAYLGIGIAPSTTGQPGARVQAIAPVGPAVAAGLRVADLVTAINRVTILDPSALVSAIAAHQPGQSIMVTVRRGSRSLALTARLGTQPVTSTTG
jgi:putative serine protease PepD